MSCHWPSVKRHVDDFHMAVSPQSQRLLLESEKIVETVFLALLATVFGTFLAIPLSFIAARNLMKPVKSPLASIALSILGWPIGIALGYLIVRWVEGFEVRWTSRYGIDAYSGSGTAHHITVAGNHVHPIGRTCTDDTGGRVGVDAYAPDLIIERNVIHDIGRLGPGENGCNPSTNHWMNHDHGVYHGRGDNVLIRNNIFYNLTRGWAVHRYGASISGLTIVNNTFAFPNPNRDGHIIVAAGTTGLPIENNIFYQPRGAGIWFSTGSSGAMVANNLSYGAPISTGSTSGITSTGNLANVDPRFVSPSGLNFRLQSGSPAIDAGLLVSLVLTDIDGVTRPQGSRHDIGAHEYR